MRNRFPGTCYRCGLSCEAGDGHFERLGRAWRVQHASCAIRFRGVQDPAREAHQQMKDEASAAGTGKKAQNARRRMRDRAGLAPTEDGR